MNDLQSQLKQQKGKNGVSLFEHLAELIRRLQQEDAKKGRLSQFDNLEILSDLIKQNYFLYQTPKSSEKVNRLVEDAENMKTDVNVQRLQTLLENLIQNQKEQFQGEVQNWLQISRMIEWNGLGFGEQNDYQIQGALKKIAKDNKTLDISLFGKILAHKKDYWVIQGRLKKYYHEDLDYQQQEMNGTGINYMTYWVSNDLLGEFEELPVISPEQMRQSRQIKRILTGRLESVVEGYPRFNGLEKHLLKCQLVRISHGCNIVPNGLLKPNDDDPKIIEYAEDYKIPEISELQSMEAWVHRLPQILKDGRITHYQDMTMNEEQRQALLDEMLANDPEQDALRAINEDSPVEPYEAGWLVKQIGDSQTFNKDDGTVSYASVIIKSLRWQGAFTVAGQGRFASLYIGYGFKGVGQSLFYPQEPNEVIEDPNEGEEKYEPNPKNPPKKEEVEADSDKDKKDDDE